MPCQINVLQRVAQSVLVHANYAVGYSKIRRFGRANSFRICCVISFWYPREEIRIGSARSPISAGEITGIPRSMCF